MKLYNCCTLKKLNSTLASEWRNEIVQLLHIEEIKCLNYYTTKTYNCTISTPWINEIL